MAKVVVIDMVKRPVQPVRREPVGPRTLKRDGFGRPIRPNRELPWPQPPEAA